MDVRSLKRDAAAAAAGQWVENIPGMEDIKLKVRGLSSPEVVQLRARKERAVGRENRLDDGSIESSTSLKLFGQVLAEAVLLDWADITDNGKPVPYSKEQALIWCTEPDFSPFADAVTWAALYVDRGISARQENLEKNSPKSSTGSSATEKQPTT